MKHKIMSVLIIATLVISMCMPNVASVQAKTFTIKDVEESDEAYDSIQSVLDQEWMSLTLGRFYPDKSISRGEFSLILTKFNNQLSEAKKVTKSTFLDLSVNNKYSKYVELQKNYITYYKSKKGKYFKPNNYLTREDALVAIVKILGYDSQEAVADGSDSEVDLDEIIADYNKVSPALESYVTLGVTNELIDLTDVEDTSYLYPKKQITRRQMAQLLVNASNSKDFTNTNEDVDESTTDTDVTKDTDSKRNTDSNKNTDKTKNTDNSKKNDSNKKSDASSDADTDSNLGANGMGYIKIEVDGTETIYRQKYADNLGQYWQFYRDKYSDNNRFSLKIPKDVEVGDVLEASSYDPYSNYPYDAQYANNSGKSYVFGFEDCKLTITITGREKSGGYVTGTLSGSIPVNNGDVISFTNGVFKYKLASTGF